MAHERGDRKRSAAVGRGSEATEGFEGASLPAAGADAAVDGAKRGRIGELVEKLLYLQIELKL